MSAFSYVALEATGKEQQGLLEGDSARHVRQLLREKGLTPLQVQDAGKGGRKRSGKFSLMQRGLPVRDLAMITRQFATLEKAGMPVEQTLKAISQQSEKPRIKSMILAVRGKVLEGYTVAQAMADYPAAFPDMYRATVAAGEHAGHLGPVLERLADYTERSQESRQKIQLKLLYPVLLLVTSIAIVSFLLGFVVPDVVKVFADTGQELPQLTQNIIAASDFIKDYGLLVVVLLVALIAGFRYALRSARFRMAWHRFILRLPLVGKVSRESNTARFANTLSILGASGVPLVEAIRIAGQVLSNEAIKEAVEEAGQRVSEGSGLRIALEQSGYFPPMMLHMIASGEQSGRLDDMLERTAANQERELESMIEALVGLFEPLMLLMMGAVVMIIVMAILLPILNMNQLV